MARRRPDKGASLPNISLKQPDRSGPSPNDETLLELAKKSGLLKETSSLSQYGNNATPDVEADPPISRFGEAVLWSISISMLHFTFDVLIQHQYAKVISWREIITRSLQAFGVILLLFYTLHPHPSPSIFTPRLPPKYQYLLHQLLFFLGSVFAGCYLVYITNEHGHLAIINRAPPVGCMLIWFIIELDLIWALPSLISIGTFIWLGGYSYM